MCTALVLLLGGCQSTGVPAQGRAKSDKTAITFASDADMLSALLRQAGPMIHDGGIVIMNGAGRAVGPPMDLAGVGTAAFAQRLADAGGLLLGNTPHYAFLYPQGYEVLLEARFPVEGSFAKVDASANFGDGTRMYNALAILSQSLGVSLVADNIVAEIPCGETVIRDAPLDAVIEALLRSARATPDTVIVESAEAYVFLRATTNTSAADNLLNAALSPEQAAFLEKRVALALPAAAKRPGAAVFVDEAMLLGDVLDSLGQQLGAQVRAEESMLSLPVNYTFLSDVPVRTALNLIVRQWPLAKFGFQLDDTGILLRAR